MKKLSNKYYTNISRNFDGKLKNAESQKGSAIVIALLIMVLLLGFVTLAVTRTTNETIASGNDAAESRAFEAAQASLEVMTRNFNKIFDVKLNPEQSDINNIQGQNPPGFAGYNFAQIVTQTQAAQIVVQTGGEFQGLNALRDEWQLDTTVTDPTTGVQVQLRRRFFNSRIPIFQFGIFYEDDLEFHPGPRFDFGGRVHSNGSMFLMANTGLYFSSKVSAVRDVFTDVARNGSPWTNWNENVFIKNASGSYVQLRNNMGSVLQNPVNGSPEYGPEMPVVYPSTTYPSNENLFQGNLKANTDQPLNLPIKSESLINDVVFDYIEIIKRGKSVGDLYNDGTGSAAAPNIVPVTIANADSQVTVKDRYANKAGIRVSLADSKAKLPGCASGVGTAPVAGPCGVVLNRKPDGTPNALSLGEANGYRPQAMTDGYQATEINGERFGFGPTSREIWIKIETVGYDVDNTFQALDITQDILSLGVTQPPNAPPGNALPFTLNNYGNIPGNADSRSIIKLQRFNFYGSNTPNPGLSVVAADAPYITAAATGSFTHNYVQPATVPSAQTCATGTPTLVDTGIITPYGDNPLHWKETTAVSGVKRCVVPFPINMFDTREGLFNDTTAVFNPTTAYPSGVVPWNGVMSLVDIDVANLQRFLNGEFNNTTPTNTPFAIANGRLQNTDIFSANGWVFYVSDRRGDFDFDGEYDMEDIYGNNDGILQVGEDINANLTLQANYYNPLPIPVGEAVRYTGAGNFISPAAAATFEHPYYRRGVRLINGQRLPGNYDNANPNNTQGFTVASENGVYVLGNYNATGINVVGTPTASSDYLPQNTPAHVPASIAADAVMVLSNNWSDARSFRYPFSLANRPVTETFVRFAMLAGDARSSLNGTPNQGGGDPRLTGGVHNFKRFLENWGGTRLNYAGSLINLYNAHNNNGAFKCCNTVYSPPTRNWVFDATFLDPNRLPPGTPFFQAIRITGFQRVNN